MNPITVEATIKASKEKVWERWTTPAHIQKWCFASEDWEVGDVENNLSVGGRFKTVMRAKDGSSSFDFTGVYVEVEPGARLAYVMDDGRKVAITLREDPEGVVVTETFDPEGENSTELQRTGWQAILDSFKKYTEAN